MIASSCKGILGTWTDGSSRGPEWDLTLSDVWHSMGFQANLWTGDFYYMQGYPLFGLFRYPGFWSQRNVIFCYSLTFLCVPLCSCIILHGHILLGAATCRFPELFRKG